jgi:predicted nucleotidyltransferase
MTEAQQALAERLARVLEEDPRVLSVWLTGSLGQGKGDRWSDVDILAVVPPDDLRPCLDTYGGEHPDLPATVLKREIYGRIITAVTPAWDRYDISFVLPPEFARMDGAGLKPLAGDVARPPAHPPPKEARTPAIEPLIVEFLRVLGLAPVAFGREEWLVVQQGIELMRNMLIDLMLAEEGISRADRGAKRLNEFLTAEQRAILESLDPPATRRDALLAANRTLARLFLTRAKPLAARAGVSWPEALETATRKHLEAELSLEI